MKELVFLLEEESSKALLESILPRFIPLSTFHYRFILFEGKQDLQKQVERKLRGYLNPSARFIILRDQDKEDCKKIKRTLMTLCSRAGKADAIVRIACRELEAFYLADLSAVESGLGLKGVAAKQQIAKFRDPDKLQSPSRELEKLTSRRYQKIAGSRAIGPHLDLDNTRSKSFHHLIKSIKKAAL